MGDKNMLLFAEIQIKRLREWLCTLHEPMYRVQVVESIERWEKFIQKYGEDHHGRI